jgi:hypothetical protein
MIAFSDSAGMTNASTSSVLLCGKWSVSIRSIHLTPVILIKEIDIVDVGVCVERLVEDICNGVELDEIILRHKVVLNGQRATMVSNDV